MENLIWGMKVIAFSQIEYEKGHSHEYIKAVDMQGSGSGKEDFFAPCTCKVTAISNSAHTVFYVSCDSKGNEAKVHCADGKDRVVTFALTHCDDINWIKIGKIFKSGERCYTEGTYASGKKGAVETHVHLEVADGKVTFKTSFNINGSKGVRFNNAVSLMPTEVFFALNGWNSVREDKLSGVNNERKVELKYVSSRTKEEVAKDMRTRMKATKEVVVLRDKLSFSGKKPNGKILAKLAKGETAGVIGYYPIQKDGYQWLKVNYNGIEGVMQYDSKCYELEEVQ